MSDVQDQAPDAAPSSTEPAVGAADAGNASPAPSSQSTDAATPATTSSVESSASIPEQPPVDNAHVAEGATPFAESQQPLPGDAHAAAPFLRRLEEMAAHWGGDVWTEVRMLAAKIRDVL